MFLFGFLTTEGPITFGTTQGGLQAIVLLHMPPNSVLFIITLWVAINGTGVKGALVKVPPLMLGPVVFINRVFVISFDSLFHSKHAHTCLACCFSCF